VTHKVLFMTTVQAEVDDDGRVLRVEVSRDLDDAFPGQLELEVDGETWSIDADEGDATVYKSSGDFDRWVSAEAWPDGLRERATDMVTRADREARAATWEVEGQ
jgi:hypothetical protein